MCRGYFLRALRVALPLAVDLFFLRLTRTRWDIEVNSISVADDVHALAVLLIAGEIVLIEVKEEASDDQHHGDNRHDKRNPQSLDVPFLTCDFSLKYDVWDPSYA